MELAGEVPDQILVDDIDAWAGIPLDARTREALRRAREPWPRDPRAPW